MHQRKKWRTRSSCSWSTFNYELLFMHINLVSIIFTQRCQAHSYLWNVINHFMRGSYFLPNPLLSYLLTPWSRVLPEKLKRPNLLNKFPAFYGTQRFITVLTRARHLSLSRARLIQSMPTPPHPTSRRSILILSSHLRHQILYHT